MLIAAVSAVLFFFGWRVQGTEWQISQSEVISSGGYAAVSLGDDVRIRPACTTRISIYSGFTAVGLREVAAGRTTQWRASGFDQYRFDARPNCAFRVTVRHAHPVQSPLAAGALFTTAILLAIGAFGIGFFPQTIKTSRDAFGLGTWLVFAVSTAIFAVFPKYLHNDAIGFGFRRNWGYRGWGYIDTMIDVVRQVKMHGFAGIAMVQDFGKPFLLQAVALPLAHFGIIGAQIFSIGLTGAAAAALYAIAVLANRRAVGIIAACFFASNSIVLAYAASFYQECGLIAAALWASVMFALACKGRPFAGVAGFCLAVLSVSSKHPLAAPLVAIIIFAATLYMGVPLRRALSIAAASAVVGFAGAVALWPKLWSDIAFRLPDALGARIVFDQVHHISLPLSVRAAREIVAWVTALSPIEAVLVAGVLVFAAFARERRLLLVLPAAIGAVLAFTLPSSFFLQHYLLYETPFVAFACGEALVLLGRIRFGVLPVGAAAVALQVLWLVPFFPYAGMARLSCFSADCSLRRFGPGEPVYGLREAARWLQLHASPNDAIATAVAPHILQANLPGWFVLSLPHLYGDARDSERELSRVRPEFVVTNAWSEYYGTALQRPELLPVYRAPARDGLVTIYRYKGAARRAEKDVKAALLLPLISSLRSRIVLVGEGAQILNSTKLSGAIQITRLTRWDGPPVSPCNVGTGLLLIDPDFPLDREMRSLHVRSKKAASFDAFDYRSNDRACRGLKRRSRANSTETS